MPPRTIVIPGGGTQTLSAQLPQNLGFDVQSVVASIDAGGSPDTVPVLTVAEPSGVVIAGVPQDEPVPSGDTGQATWALRLAGKPKSGSGQGAGLPVPPWTVNYTTGEVVGKVNPLPLGPFVVSPLTLRVDGTVAHVVSYTFHRFRGFPFFDQGAQTVELTGGATMTTGAGQTVNIVGGLGSIAVGSNISADVGDNAEVYGHLVRLSSGNNATAVGGYLRIDATTNTVATGHAVEVKGSGLGTQVYGIDVLAVGDAPNDGTTAARLRADNGFAIDCVSGLIRLDVASLPTSDPGIMGCLWNDGGTVKVSP